MIILLCYWYMLLWNVELDKMTFAAASAAEVFLELCGILIWFLIWFGERK